MTGKNEFDDLLKEIDADFPETEEEPLCEVLREVLEPRIYRELENNKLKIYE